MVFYYPNRKQTHLSNLHFLSKCIALFLIKWCSEPHIIGSGPFDGQVRLFEEYADVSLHKHN